MSKLKNCLAKTGVVKDEEISLAESFGKNNVKKLLDFKQEYIEQGMSEMEAETNAVIKFSDSLVTEMNQLKLQVKEPTQKLFDRGRLKDTVKEVESKYDALEEIQKQSYQFDLKDTDLEYLLDKGYDNAAITKGIKEANRILKLPTNEMFKELQKIGVFNLGKGEKFDARPNVGLSTEDYNNTLKQIEKGKETKTVEWLNNYLVDLKKSGELKMIMGVGGASEKYSLPLYFQVLGEKSNAERGLSAVEETEMLEKEVAQKEYEAVVPSGEQYQKPKTKKVDIGEGEANYKKWKGENKEYSGADIQDIKTGEKVMLTVYHGTTNEFYEFDSSKKGNIEGHLGKINYFTSDKGDADQNYLSGGADLTSRIERRKDELEQQLEDNYGDIFKSKKQIAEDYGFTSNQITALGSFSALAKAIAEKELKGKKERTLKLHIKLNNPLVLGNKSTWVETIPEDEYSHELDSATEQIAEENDITIEEAKSDYDYDIRQRAIENAGAENKIITALQDAIDNNAYRSDISASEILGDEFFESEIDLNKLEKRLRNEPGITSIENDNGELSSSQIIADFFENLGYDGIILTDVSSRFRNMGIGGSTSHVHVFDKYANQIKLADGTNKTFNQETKDIRYQKQSESKSTDVQKVVERMQKSLPKFKISYDEKLNAAGKIKGNEITINPFYAGKDTPIHEAGHALIDFIGYGNKVIQKGIEQLKSTDLWKETKERYPELNDEMLGKEVLAEAIGREGAGIFDTEVEKGKFRQILDYIFDWLKRKLGLEKNVAKSLAKQIISGIGTKNVQAEVVKEGKKVSLQMPSGEKVDGKEVQVDVVNGFYSNLEKQLLQIKLDKIPAKQWADKLKGEEAKWTGLTDWLNSQQGSVSKKDIQDFLKNNRISIVEVVKGGEFDFDKVFEIEDKGDEVEVVYADKDMGEQNPYSAYINDEGLWEAYDFWNENSVGEFNTKEDAILAIRDDAEKTKSKEELTKFSQYQLEGERDNYKEVLVTMPSVERKSAEVVMIGEKPSDGYNVVSNGIVLNKTPFKSRIEANDYVDSIDKNKGKSDFKSSHFDEPNILVHLRMNTRTDAEGNKILFLEELQSDWGQKGKREGFVKDVEKTKWKEPRNVNGNKVYDSEEGDFFIIDRGGGRISLTNKDAEEIYDGNYKTVEEAKAAVEKEASRFKKGTPFAPFVTDTNAWTKLGLKVALKEAVKQGADKIAWTTGEQQNDRYDLSKQVDRIVYAKNQDGTYRVYAEKNGSKVIDEKSVLEKNLESSFGKDVAKRIIENAGDDLEKNDELNRKVLKGENLSVGGKGMKGFYGSPSEGNLGIVGSVAKKLFNQEPKTITIGKYEVVGDYDRNPRFSTLKEAEKELETNKRARRISDKDVSTQYSIDITPELIQQVGGGLPMFQKPKKFKELDELTQSELQRKITKTFEGFRTDVLKRDLTDIRNMLIQAKEGIASEETSEEDKIIYQQVLDALKLQEKRDKSKWMAYKEDRAMVKELLGKKSIKDMTVEELVETYNLLTSGNLQSQATEEDLPEIKKNLAYKLFTERKEELKKYKNFVEQQANVTDLKPKDVLMKTLSHMSESFPELQKFGTIFDNAYFDMQTDRNDLKTDLEKLGKEVIKEKNKQLGIKDKRDAFIFSNSAKYFDFVEHPDGRYYTLEEAKQKGFTEAQTKFLKFMLNLNKLRNEQLASTEVVDEVLKVDKSVGEAFQTEGIMQAFSSYLGNGFNIKNVVIDYDGKKMPYGEVEKDLMKQGEKGTIDKAIALAKILKYNFRARRQLKTGVDANQKPINTQEAAEYQLSPDGQLRSKFNKSRDKGRSYSKDFYHAAFEFIDDYTHVKHMNPIMPYINSIEELNKSEFEEHAAKPNVVKWIQEWKDLHLFKQKKVGQLGPEIDVALKTLRKISSATTMFFNLPANAWNVAMGTYNNIRSETGEGWYIGSKRLAKDWVKGGKAVDILNKYQVVSIDRDSNPKLFAGRILDQLGYMFNRLGETYIQGSMFLGQMTDEEFNSFEYKTDEYGVKKLVVKPGIDENKLRERFISYKNRVSDIQGKYAEKDMRNFTNSEFGKAIGQYKIWLPDAIKERFGERYIDRNGVEHVGSYRAMFGQGLEDLRAEIKENGMASLMNSNSTEAKAFRTNLKGAMVLGVLFSLKAAADDDDEESAIIDKALSQILFIFDPHQLKFTISNPIPAVGVLNNFLNVLDDAKQGKFEKAGKGAAKLVPMNKIIIETEKLLEEN